MLVWSAQNWSISSEICLENNHKIGRFLPIAFLWSMPRKLPRNSREIGRFFRKFVPQNPAKFDFFFRDLSEALSMCDQLYQKHPPPTDNQLSKNQIKKPSIDNLS